MSKSGVWWAKGVVCPSVVVRAATSGQPTLRKRVSCSEARSPVGTTRSPATPLVPLSLCFALLLTACGAPSGTDGGTDAGVSLDGGAFRVFFPPATTGPGNTVLVTASGEAAAVEGIAFPPASTGGAPYFVDGWELTFDHVLVTVGAVTLSENPDRSPQDQSQTGPLVARAEGPWAIDLARGGPLDAKELNGQATPLVRFTRQDQKTGAPAFDVTSKYALGYSLVTATSGVLNVNLDDDGQRTYLEMISKGFSVVLQGTATWKGAAGSPACRTTDSSFDFARFPRKVGFTLGFKAPVEFKNCINPELTPADSRGVQTQSSAQTLAQLTFHLDHPFWEALSEDAPLRFDALAARRSVPSGAGLFATRLTIDDLGFDFLAPKDAQSSAIPWRTCGPSLGGERTTGTVAYDPVNVPVSPAGGAAGLANLVDYMTYNLSTFGHLNNDGLCFPDRQFAAPK